MQTPTHMHKQVACAPTITHTHVRTHLFMLQLTAHKHTPALPKRSHRCGQVTHTGTLTRVTPSRFADPPRSSRAWAGCRLVPMSASAAHRGPLRDQAPHPPRPAGTVFPTVHAGFSRLAGTLPSSPAIVPGGVLLRQGAEGPGERVCHPPVGPPLPLQRGPAGRVGNTHAGARGGRSRMSALPAGRTPAKDALLG